MQMQHLTALVWDKIGHVSVKSQFPGFLLTANLALVVPVISTHLNSDGSFREAGAGHAPVADPQSHRARSRDE